MLNLHLNNSVIQHLSANELAILEYIYEHHEDVVHMSIRELSQAVSYSSATILRFCKKLGLSGFSELKFALRNEAEDPKQKTENIPILSNQSIIDTIETEVTGTANLIKNDHFREIIALLASDLPIYLWSPGGITSILIDYMEKLLICLRTSESLPTGFRTTGEAHFPQSPIKSDLFRHFNQRSP